MHSLTEIKTTLEHKGHRVLLSSLMLVILASPFLQYNPALGWLFSVFIVLALLAAVRTVSGRAGEFRLAVVLGALAVAPQFGLFIDQPGWLETVSYTATTIFLLLVCGLLLRDIIVRSHTVTLNLILGTINIYLMTAIAFAFAYGLIEHVLPGSFTGLEEFGNGNEDVINFLYFSFVTMTTLGYGDISPLTPFGMTAAYAQATFGQLYLTILVARLVSMYIGNPKTVEEVVES